MGYGLVDIAELDFGGVVAAGRVRGWGALTKYGERAAGTTNEQVVWDGPTENYTGWLQSAQRIRVRAGGNAADTLLGAGAQKIRIYGLDENWQPVQEEIELAGASASAYTTTTFFRNYRGYVLQAGSYGATNVGDITLEAETGEVMSVIKAGKVRLRCSYSA